MVSRKMTFSKYEQVDFIKKELVKANNKLKNESQKEATYETNLLIDMLESILETLQKKRD